jgi:hypothetical protein
MAWSATADYFAGGFQFDITSLKLCAPSWPLIFLGK